MNKYSLNSLDQTIPPASENVPETIIDINEHYEFFPDSEHFGFTISPKDLHLDDYELSIFVHLFSLQDYMRKYKPIIYAEFSPTGRLHYHAIVRTDDNNYAKHYNDTANLEYTLRHNKVCIKEEIKSLVKNKLGYWTTKYKNNTILRASKVQILCKPEMVFRNGAIKWYEYITKEVVRTKRILPKYNIITYESFNELKRTILLKYKIFI